MVGIREVEEGRNTTLFTAIVGGGILEGEAGFDSQGSHLGGAQSMVEVGGRKEEIDLIREKLFIEWQRGDEVIVV